VTRAGPSGPAAEGSVVRMARATRTHAARGLLVAAGVAAVLAAVVHGTRAAGAAVPTALLSFAAAAVAAAGLQALLPRFLPDPVARDGATRYAALAEAARRGQSGSLEQALPGLARVVAEGTGASRAVVWLAVGPRLVAAAVHPPESGAGEESVADLAALLAHPDTDSAVPVLDGPVLRAVLAIRKPSAVSAADRQLMQDVAGGAALVLRVAALNAELAERVQRAAALAGELHASRHRLASARDAERRRLVAELAYATGDRLADLRAEVTAARAALDGDGADPAAAQAVLGRARERLDELLERFRAVARGVYPAVLRDQGPAAALDEVVADLPRPVRTSGGTAERLPWELESGIYYAAATAVRALAGRPADTALLVRLEHAAGRIVLEVEDPAPLVPAGRLVELLADDADRLAALGGGVELEVPARGGLLLRAELPDRVEPVVVEAAGTEVAVR
jgi:signal transduction histidine kinase